jgi:membrane protein
VGLSERASAIAFNFLMAIPPATIFLCTLIPYMPISKQIHIELLLLADAFTPDYGTYLVVKGFLEDFLNTPRTGLLSLGFVLAVFYSSNAMMGIMSTFNKSLIKSNKRNFIESRWIAIKLTSLFILLVIVCMTLLILQGAVLQRILEWIHIKDPVIETMISSVRWVVIIGFVYYVIAFIYKYAPAVHKRWKLTSPGTILATALIIGSTFLFSFWLNTFGNYNKVYGSIGTIMIIMLLTYINSLVLLIGFELNVSIYFIRIMAEEHKKQEDSRSAVIVERKT